VTPKCPTLKKLCKSGTLWEHLPKRYYLWTIINQKKEKKWDTLGLLKMLKIGKLAFVIR